MAPIFALNANHPYRGTSLKNKNIMTEEKKLSWFKLMWINFYIQLFVIAIVSLAVMLIEKDTFYSPVGFYVGISIPIGIMIIIGYKGFYQFWQDYKEGKSR